MLWINIKNVIHGIRVYKIRYDYDPDHENGTMHPLHHLDVNYSSQGTYKLGMNRKIQTDEFVDMLDVKTACRYIQKK